MRRGEKTADDLDRPDGNGLEANYELHDVGHAEFVDRCNDLDLTVGDWGIDMRHDDGEDGVIYDDKMDFKVYAPPSGADAEAVEDGEVFDERGNLVALVDVKTKSSARWMGRFNERHYTHYYQHAADFDVPTFVVMFQVDSTTDEIQDEFVFQLNRGSEVFDRVESSRVSDAVSVFPDGNNAVLVPHENRRRWQHFELAVSTERMRKRMQDDDLEEYYEEADE